MKLRFSNIVWGKAFTHRFLTVSLPSHLSPNNLKYAARHADCRYRIYSTATDAQTIRRSRAYADLAALMPVEIAEISGLRLVSHYQAMTQCHVHFLQSLRSEDAAIVMANPDWIWADGATARLVDLALAGMRLVATTTPRVAAESFLPEYLSRYGAMPTVSSRDLIALAMHHLHPITQTRMWEQTGARSCAGELWWKVGDEGLLARHFHLHPILVRPVDREAVPRRTIDSDYIATVACDWDSVYLVQDSDDICVLDFTSLSTHPGDLSVEGNTIEDVIKWAAEATLPMHRRFVLGSSRFHWRDLSPKWQDMEARADAVVQQILRRLDATRAAPNRLSRTRYLRPSFWIAKIASMGLRHLGKTVWRRALQRFGTMIGRGNVVITLKGDYPQTS